MLTQGPPAVPRMTCADDEDFHDMMVSEEEGSPPSTYEITMVSLSGILLLLVAISVAISVLRRRCTSNYSSKDLRTPVVVENIIVMKRSSDKVSTADVKGPVCINCVSEKTSLEPAAPEEAVFEFPFFSCAVSIKPPDSVPQQ